jgi:hypothetical protein
MSFAFPVNPPCPSSVRKRPKGNPVPGIISGPPFYKGRRALDASLDDLAVQKIIVA